MKSDNQLLEEIMAALQSEHCVEVTEVGVIVQDGIVTLTGHLGNYAQRNAVERAVQSVDGVAAIAIELTVRLDPSHVMSDTELAHAVDHTLQWHADIPENQIKVIVEKGMVTLQGQVAFDDQRWAAVSCVRNLRGVAGVIDLIQCQPAASGHEPAMPPASAASVLATVGARR